MRDEMPEREASASEAGAEEPGRGVALDELVEATGLDLRAVVRERAPALAAMGGEALLVGECLDAEHPTLRGRILVRWDDVDGEPVERWLPTLYRLPVRPSDRVLLARPANWDETVVLGVIDGFARRPRVPAREAATLALAPDECVKVRARDGTELLEVRQEEDGPVVRLLRGDVDVELPGALRLRAEAIRLEASRGAVELEATDDVVVRGEIIRLN